jgi:hypothetical protein
MSTKIFPIILLVVCGLSFGIALILFQARSTPESEAFIQTVEFGVWLFMVALTCLMMFTTPFILARDLKQLWVYRRGHEADLIFSVLSLALLFFVPYIYTNFLGEGKITYPLAYHSIKVIILFILGFLLVALPGALGIWLIRLGLIAEFQHPTVEANTIKDFLHDREMLQRFLLILGTLVALTTLMTSSLRNAVIVAGASTPENFPVIGSLIYGAYFTLVLIILYFPAYSQLLESGRRVRDVYCPLPLPDTAEWEKVLARRKVLEDTLQLNQSVQQNLQTGIIVLAPMLSGILSVLLN